MRQSKLNAINRPKAVVRPAASFSEVDRAQFLSELKCWAEIKGFKPGFAAAQFKERFGAWPPWGFKNLQAAQNVSAETMAYIEERKKLWTKQRKKERKAAAVKLVDMGRMDITQDDYISLSDWRP